MIKAENVKSKYMNENDSGFVLCGVNLQIKKGEFVAILGHNGSGKSTLAKHFNGIMQPLTGDVFVDGINTKDEERIYEIRQKIGMVFQNPDNQMVSSVVEDDVAFAPENLGVPREEIRKRVDFALKAVGMYDYRHKTPHLLSGGQKQRVAIAGIIAMSPECIVLDESTAMLDPEGRKDVIETIIKLNKEEGITVVLITHFMEEAARAKRVVVMDKGKVLMDGTPKEIFKEHEELKKIGLSVPQSAMLIQELKKCGVSIESEAIDVKEAANDLIAFFEKRGILNDRT